MDSLEEFKKKLADKLDNMSAEEKEKFFPEDNTPKGWISIEDELPMMLAMDLQTGTEYKVKYKDGTIGTSNVMDHNMWYYMAKQSGITHWLNE